MPPKYSELASSDTARYSTKDAATSYSTPARRSSRSSRSSRSGRSSYSNRSSIVTSTSTSTPSRSSTSTPVRGTPRTNIGSVRPSASIGRSSTPRGGK